MLEVKSVNLLKKKDLPLYPEGWTEPVSLTWDWGHQSYRRPVRGTRADKAESVHPAGTG